MDNTAAADRGSAYDRKRSKRSRTRKGTWTDWTNQEPEESPDKQLEQMEWQIKTQARKIVREAAEAEGLVCYYPDGSYKDGCSGRLWIVHQKEKERASDCGPVRL